MEIQEYNDVLWVVQDCGKNTKARQKISHPSMFASPEGPAWLKSDLSKSLPPALLSAIEVGKAGLINTHWAKPEEWQALPKPTGKKRLHLLALGDVGGTLLTALVLLGGDTLSEIGIYDVNPNACKRWAYEMNQTTPPWQYDALPPVKILTEEALFDCDVFVFCASKGVPPVGSDVKDVRMAQLSANQALVAHYARMAKAADFRGLFAVVSDPVDPLCRTAFLAGKKNGGSLASPGLLPEQVQGFGLGVMNARAAYFAKQDARFASFLTEGRAFGPHGEDLVIANSIAGYDDALSRELTHLAVTANLRVRETGYKPYLAPAFSSAAFSLLFYLRGEWQYTSLFLGGVYLGCKNRLTSLGLEIEQLPLPPALYDRILHAYQALEAIPCPD